MMSNMSDIFGQMVAKQASDLFVTAGLPVSVKLNGELVPLVGDKLSADDAKQLVLSCMSEKQKAEFELDRECFFAVAYESVRFRVSAFWQGD
jgi:twitching motility protein PilU